MVFLTRLTPGKWWPLLACVLLALLSRATFAVPEDAPEVTESTPPTLWQVGPEREFQRPSDVAKLARDGDTIEIDAGTYQNDYATWTQDQLTIRGVGGMAHMQSRGLIPNGKAIWIMAGGDAYIENVEFSGATVVDTNGAGIRHESGNLRLHNTYFHQNEFSVLTGGQPGSKLEITDSRFWFQRRATRFSHGIYVGELDRFSITGSHFKGTDRGHQIKSRALENHILYNRIEDVPQGNSSRLIDLPNCGLSIIMGNDLHQAATTHNVDAIGFGAEGCNDRKERELKLYVINNTFINEASSGSLARNHSGATALVANNHIVGRGFHLLGNGVKQNNVRSSIARWKRGVWTPQARSKAVDGSKPLLPVEGRLLIPTKVFNPPVGSTARPVQDELDIGSRDYLASSGAADTSEP